MGYSGETNDINFSSGTTAFYGFLGFLTCSIASQSNALGQDTSNSDSIAVGNDYDFSFAGQGNGYPGSGNMIIDYISMNGDCIFACQNAAGTSFNTLFSLLHNILV